MRQRIVVASALLLCGCVSPTQEGFVSEQWTSNMLELGIYPVFPPREDIYVGDIFVTYGKPGDATPSDAAGAAASAASGASRPKVTLPSLGVYFGRVDVAPQLKAQYQARPEFGTPAASAAAGTSAATPSLTSVFDGPAIQSRLKTVAFPYFFKATASGTELGAFIPVDGLPLKAGLGLDSVQSASVTISSAESYSLPWIDLVDQVVDEQGRLKVGAKADAARTLAALRHLANYDSGGPGIAAVYVTIVSEVFYARSFDVTFHLSKDAAASAGLSLPSGSAASAAEAAASAATTAAATATTARTAAVAATDAASAAPDSASAAAAAASAATAAVAAQTASDLAQAAQARADAALAKAQGLAPSAPGVNVGFVKSQSGDVGLRSTYDHAIAIGYRGVRYRLDLADGRLSVVNAAVVGGTVRGADSGLPAEHAPAASGAVH